MNKIKKSLGILALIALLVHCAGVIYASLIESRVERNTEISSEDENQSAMINSFEECKAAGNPIMESYPEQCSANGQTFTNQAQSATNGWSDAIASGQGGFSLRLPEQWGDVLKPTDSDWFIIPGMTQPEGSTEIQEVPSYGSDSPIVFSALIHDNFAPAEGQPEEYVLVNGKENPVNGTKYTKIYETDQKVGIGIQRFAGDRDYVYVFPLADGKELRVYYSVYGQDPRNNMTVVEAIIDSILLN